MISRMHMPGVSIYGMTETPPASTQTRADDSVDRRTARSVNHTLRSRWWIRHGRDGPARWRRRVLHARSVMANLQKTAEVTDADG